MISQEENKQDCFNSQLQDPIGKAIQNLRTNLLRDTAQVGLSLEKHVQYTALRNEVEHFSIMYDNYMQNERQKEDVKSLENKISVAK